MQVQGEDSRKARKAREDEKKGTEAPGAPFVEPRWGSVIWAIGNPACATRHWALEFNAFGVEERRARGRRLGIRN